MNKTVLVLCLLIFCASLLAFPSEAATVETCGFIVVSAGSSGTVSMGTLLAGDVISYCYTTDDSGDSVSFSIRDSSGNIHQSKSGYRNSGTFTVPTTDTYSLRWYCSNWWMDADIWYDYSREISPILNVQHSFSKNPCPQGETSILTSVISNPNDFQIRLNEIGYWSGYMSSGVYITDSNIDSTPQVLSTGGSFTSLITINIPVDTPMGNHKYVLWVEYSIQINSVWYDEEWCYGCEENVFFYVSERDRDGDGVPDSIDKFPDDPAASLDTDGDGYPDEWNFGKTQADSTTGLRLDAFPNDPAASLDTDGDGYPDEWNTGKTQADSTTGLRLDAFPNDPTRWEEDNTICLFSNIATIIGIFSIGILIIWKKKTR